MKKLIALFLMSAAIYVACGDSPTYEPYDDEEALIDIVTKDYPTLFETNLINTGIPDTTELARLDDLRILHYWRDVTGNNPHYDINANYPESLGTTPYAIVTVTDSIEMDIHVIAEDTTADSLVRITKPVYEKIQVKGRMEQWGTQYDSRNGWIMQDISNAKGSSGSAYNAISSVNLYSLSTGDITIYESQMTSLTPITSIINTTKNQEVTITVQGVSFNDTISFHVGRDEYEVFIPEYIGDNTYQGVITTPDYSGYFHITVDVIRKNTLAIESTHQFCRWSILLFIPS
ncbi:MAG: hypothetical protein GF315_10110 [candidate division Zixibacteria bacterium]|nr:hypothetical protein [candidate division Zixibacteria bacterium]